MDLRIRMYIKNPSLMKERDFHALIILLENILLLQSFFDPQDLKSNL